MKRHSLSFVVAAFVVAACSDSDVTTGPSLLGPSANVTTVALGAGSAFGSDVCGTVTDPTDGLPGEQIASPCDGNSNLDPATTHDPAKLPFTGSTFWLASFEKSPSPIPPNFGGLASRLVVKAYPYPDRATCEMPVSAGGYGGSGNDCAIRENLPAVTEVIDPTSLASIRYATNWKSKKSKKGGPGAGDLVPNNSYWQLVLFLDFDGDGVTDSEDIASRIIKWTDTPSSDNPLDGWSLDINWGSNQPVPFVLEANQSGCFGTARAILAVQCLVDFGLGGTLVVETSTDGTQGVPLEIGAGNTAVGVRLVTGEVCEQGDLDVDTPTLGACITWTLDPPLTTGDPNLTGTFIYACENLGSVAAATFFMQDADGTQALEPISQGDATAACNNLGLTGLQISQADPGTGLQFVVNKVKELFTPTMLIATDGSSGSRLLTVRSDYQLVETGQMRPVGGVTTITVPENSSGNTVQAIVKDHADEDGGQPLEDAVVYVYSDESVVCTPGTDCTPLGAPGPLDIWSTGVMVTTGADGIVSADVSVGTTSATVWMLGCGIAVPGSDTPADGGFSGDGGLCDRDPSDVDGPDGYANGVAVGIVDPFMRNGVVVPVWVNDLPITYTLQVCAAPVVDGVKDANDPWSQGSPSACVPPGFNDSFEVNVGGNLGGGQGLIIADLEWVVATDPDGFRRIYFGLEIPLGSDPTGKKVSVAIEFDQGDGSPAGSDQSDEFDDQLELNLDKFSTLPTGNIFDRYLTASCAGNNSISVCNALDTDLVGNNADAEGALAWDEGSSTLFVEMSQKLDGDDPVDLHDIVSGEWLGFILQIGVGNVRQGGTVFPEQVGGRRYRSFQIP